jgi:hypothetical protein
MEILEEYKTDLAEIQRLSRSKAKKDKAKMVVHILSPLPPFPLPFPPFPLSHFLLYSLANPYMH